MPRQGRLEVSGVLNHIIVRSIDRRPVFGEERDRQFLLDRLGSLLLESKTPCYGWALMPDHLHLLLRAGAVPVSTLMRRLLTGFAVNFNRRRDHTGPLFQDRYKSILCQEDTYLLELVRYIHLNPVRVRQAAGLHQLDRYPYTGHSVLMGNRRREWQDSIFVLQRFGTIISQSRRRYHEYVMRGLRYGRRPDLVGGGLLRSTGGWSKIKALRKENERVFGDERILGDSAFVARIHSLAQASMQSKYHLAARGWDVDRVAGRVADLLAIPVEAVWAPGRKRPTVRGRSLTCYWSVKELGVSLAELSRRFGISSPAISKAVARGQKLARQLHYQLGPD